MAMTDIQICELALLKIGNTTRLAALTDESDEARLCNRMFSHCLRLILSEHDWNFVTKRIELSIDTNVTPLYEFDYAYTLPADFLRLLEVEGNPAFRIEEGYVYTNQSTDFNIKYVYMPATYGKLPHAFIDAFACLLASEICTGIGGTIQTKQALKAEYRLAVQNAIIQSRNQRDRDKDDVPNPDWLDSFSG